MKTKTTVMIFIIFLSVFCLFYYNKHIDNNSKASDQTQVITKENSENLSSNSIIENDFEELITYVNLILSKSTKTDRTIVQDDCFFPVSYIKDNKQIFVDGNNINYTYRNPVPYERIYENDIKNIIAKDYYDENSSKFEDLLDDDIIFKYNGDWNVILGKVLYTDYINTGNIPNEEWISFFEKELQKHTADKIPVNITESWQFEYNGIKYEAVNATNVVDYDIAVHEKDYGIAELPAAETPVVYKMTAVFVENNQPIMIESFVDGILIKKTESSKYVLFMSHSSDENINNIMYKYNIFFYSDSNEISKYTVYTTEICDREYGKHRYSPLYVFADIDGDKTAELVYDRNANSSDYEKVKIYKLKNDNIIKVFETS